MHSTRRTAFQQNVDFQKTRLLLGLAKPQDYLLHDAEIKRRQPDMGVDFNTGILAAAFPFTGSRCFLKPAAPGKPG